MPGLVVLLVFVCYCYQNKKKEDSLCCKALERHTPHDFGHRYRKKRQLSGNFFPRRNPVRFTTSFYDSSFGRNRAEQTDGWADGLLVCSYRYICTAIWETIFFSLVKFVLRLTSLVSWTLTSVGHMFFS